MKTKVATKPRGRPRKVQSQEVSAYQGPQSPKAISETEALIHAITTASRDPKVDIEKMDWLLKTAVGLKEDQARVDYNDAMARVQADLEPVRRAALNPQTQSKYATEAALDAEIRPAYIAEGFALEFDTEAIPDRDDRWVMVVCYVSRGRERRRHQIPMPCDGLGPKGTPVMSRTHATGSAFSYGRRYLRCAIFNVITADMAKQDDDGNAAGGRVGKTLRDLPPDPKVVQDPQPSDLKTADDSLLKTLRAIMKQADVEEDIVLETFGVESLEDLSETECKQAIKKCNKKLEMLAANASTE